MHYNIGCRNGKTNNVQPLSSNLSFLHSFPTARVERQKWRNEMEIVFNKQLNGWQIVWLKTAWHSPAVWGKSVNGKVYDSWESASHDIDKWSE